MNNRIKELAEQAAIFAEAEYAKQTMATFDTNKSTQELYEEKFAELIALECAELMEQQHTWITSVAASKAIRVHFGVE